MRALFFVLMALAAGLLAWLLILLADTAAPPPAVHAPVPDAAPDAEAVPPMTAALPRTADTESAEMEDGADAADAESAHHPLTIRLHAPAEWREGIPVEIVWSVDPITRRAAVSGFRTDEEGRARCRFTSSAPRSPWLCADLAFPTMGLSSALIPDEGGEVTVPMVLPAWLDVEVVAGDGPPTESVLLELRAPAARPPGDRWHRHRLPEGRARLMVEAGIDLEVRASTPSGRSAAAQLRAPTEPEAGAPCRLELDSGGGARIAVRTSDGGPLADREVEVIHRDRWLPLPGSARRTDDRGELLVRLPRTILHLPQVDLLLRADVEDAPHYAEVVLDFALLRDGGRIEATLLPAPRLVEGAVVDPSGRGNRGTLVELQLGLQDRKAQSDDDLVWLTIASVAAGDDGAFAIDAFSPRGAPLRLRLPEAQDLDPIPVQSGAYDLRIEAPVRRSAFGMRRR